MSNYGTLINGTLHPAPRAVRIGGAVVCNPLQGRIAELTARYSAAIERATSAEARAERLDRLRDWLVEQRDKALLPTTKAIYQAILDRLEAVE